MATTFAYKPAVMATQPPAGRSTIQIRIGRAISGLAIAFLSMDAVMKFVKPAPVLEASAHLGLAESLIAPIGVILLVCTILYLIPATSILGAILLTGYLGGALFGNLRAGDPLFSHVLFPVYMGAVVWGGLLLRESRLRALMPFRR